jgi:chromosome segregation ATPase
LEADASQPFKIFRTFVRKGEIGYMAEVYSNTRPQIVDLADPSLEKQASDLLPAGFDPHQAMRILSDYLRNLETVFTDLRKKSIIQQRQSESSLRITSKAKDDLEQERERLTRDLMHLTSQIEENDSSLLTATQKVSNYEKQVKKLHRDNEELENRLIQRDNDNNFLQSEMDRLTKDFESVNSNLISMGNRVDGLERKLATERNQALSTEKETRRLVSSLKEAQGKNQILEGKLTELTAKQAEEVKKLNERLITDSKHEVTLLKKRIKTALTPELNDLEKLSAEKLSAALASNLKALLSRFISKLQQTGVEIN